jgi:hypothetical protein
MMTVRSGVKAITIAFALGALAAFVGSLLRPRTNEQTRALTQIDLTRDVDGVRLRAVPSEVGQM